MPFPQTVRFSQFLRRIFSVKEQMADANLLQDFFPTVEMLGPTMADHMRARDEHLWGVFVSVNAAAGQVSTCLINAPKGKISVISFFNVDCAAGVRVQRTNLLVGGGAFFATAVDGRDSNQGGIGTQFEARTNIGLTATAIWRLTGSAAPSAQPISIPMFGDAPGNLSGSTLGLVIQGEAVNTALNVAVYGYERPLEPSEEIA